MRRSRQTILVAPADLPLLCSEKEFTQAVMDHARLQSWLAYHTYRSIKSEPGYPDICAVRPPRLIYAELKTETGKVSPAQAHWLDLLGKIPGVEVYMWRPRDWQVIQEVLR